MAEAAFPHFNPPALRRVRDGGGDRCVLSGAWNLRSLEQRLGEFERELARIAADPACGWDLRGVDVIDHAGAMLLWRAWGRRRVAGLALKPEQVKQMAKATFDALPIWRKAFRDWHFGAMVAAVLALVLGVLVSRRQAPRVSA